MYRSLNEYIADLERRGLSARVDVRVDSEFEIAEITDRECKREGGGRALLFTDTATDYPVLTNMFGSAERMALAVGSASLDELPRHIESLATTMLSPKAGLSAKLRGALTVARILPRKRRGRGACQQVVESGEQVDLLKLPILRCKPCDGGRFVTLPMVNTVDPLSGVRNVGMYRMQVVDSHTTAMHWQIHKTGERHYREYQRAGISRMPVSVCLGGDPVYTYAATAPMPDGMDEYMLAGYLRGRAVRLVKCVTNDLYVPEDCDFVIEGYVDTAEPKVTEGAFGDHTGFYSLEDEYPLFHVTAVTHRRDAVYPATIVGVPPMEDAYIALASERIFLAPIRLALQPEVRDMYMPTAGVAHNLVLLSVAMSYAGQARKVALSMWGAGQMMFGKCLIVADDKTDVRDVGRVAELLRGVDVTLDLEFTRGVYDALDHSTATVGFGGKLLIDVSPCRQPRQSVLPQQFEMCGGVTSVDTSLCEEWGLLVVRADYGRDVDLTGFLNRNNIVVNFVALFDTATEGLTPYELLWLGCGNTEPSRDCHVVGGMLTVDCRTKVDVKGAPERFPNVVVSSPETIAKVDARWSEYGLGTFTASPSLRYQSLVYSDKASVK